MESNGNTRKIITDKKLQTSAAAQRRWVNQREEKAVPFMLEKKEKLTFFRLIQKG